MNADTKRTIRETAQNIRDWSNQLARGWERFEEFAVGLDLNRDVLIPISYEKVCDPDGRPHSLSTLLGLRCVDDQWQLALGVGPDGAHYLDPQWKWITRDVWDRNVFMLASSRVDHLLAALAAATFETAEQIEEAAASINEVVHRINTPSLAVGAEQEKK